MSRRSLARLVLIENGVVLGASLLVGGLVGILSAAIALGSLPQVVGPSGGFPPTTGLPWFAVTLTLLSFGALLGAAAAVVSRVVVGGVLSHDELALR